MDFDNQKKQVLTREDNSKKGSIDKKVVKLCEKINSFKNYYTTSSCSGRIIIYSKKSDKKFDTDWVFVSHDMVKYSDVKKALEILPKYPTWLREEPMILHVCGRTINDAQNMLNLARLGGFKRSGLMATEKRAVIEITSTEIMDTIIADKGKMLVSENYMKRLILEANKKLKRNFAKIEKFEKNMLNI